MTEMKDGRTIARERFEAINLHDSRLLGVRIERAAGGGMDTVQLDIALLAGPRADQWEPATLTFVDCAAVALSVDLWGKRACTDAIAESACDLVSDDAAAALEQNPWRERQQPLAALLEFTIVLCPPGGNLTVIARDFALTDEARQTDR